MDSTPQVENAITTQQNIGTSATLEAQSNGVTFTFGSGFYRNMMSAAYSPGLEASASTTATTLSTSISTTANTLFDTYTMSQQSNRTRPSAEELDGRILRPQRLRTQTSRGKEYTIDLLSKRSTMITRRVKQQVAILDSLQPGIDKKTIRSEVEHLDSFLSELDSVTTRLVEVCGTHRGNTASGSQS